MRAEDVGLTPQEYAKIEHLMGRAPNELELGLFGALWSEHCSYKNTKSLLARLPHDGPHLVQGPGENAGVVRLSDNLELAFKVESHNHPSYVEPVEGAATGVGGILRDIIAMGARPVAVADMLRFGTDDKSQRLLQGVVKGVGQYGNAIGIPTVTGDLAFSDTYRSNPLVNVLAVGLRHPEGRISASTARPGNLLVLAGQRTGRDGIHGASLLASRDFSEGDQDLRPTVQVGDPFLGKLLMEATLQTVSAGLAAALQDLGAAGLTSAVVELCHASQAGANLWLERVPLRQAGLSPYEIMLSETQERMLLAVAPENLEAVRAIYDHFEVSATVIGEVTETGFLVLSYRGEEGARVKAQWLVGDAPRRDVDPRWWSLLDSRPSRADVPVPGFNGELMLEVLGDANVRDRAPIYRRYDSTIQANTVLGPNHDAAVLTVRGSDVGFALAVAGTGRWAAVDPYAGGAAAVLQALSCLAAQGAEPLGLTDGVNAGNPNVAESYRALAALLRGVADAAEASQVPVTGGNVSLHNETDGQAIWPTVMIGAVGRHPHPLTPIPDDLGEVGRRLCLVNPAPLDWGGSVAAWRTGGPSAYPRIELERAGGILSRFTSWIAATEPGNVSARAVGTGGIAVAVVKMMAASPLHFGADLTLTESGSDKTARLFNEAPLQWVVSCAEDRVAEIVNALEDTGAALVPIGVVTGAGRLRIDGRHQWSRGELLGRWRGFDKEAGA